MKKILIVRFSSIGDIVLTTPVIRCLHEQLDSEVHFITKKSFATVLEHNPYIHKLWLLEDSLQALIPSLKQEQFDHIIDLHKNIRSKLLIHKLGVPAQSFRKLNFEKWLIVNMKINRLPNVHIVDRYMETVRFLGVKNDRRGLDYFIGKKDAKTAQSLLETAGLKQFIVLVIGAAHATKVPPMEELDQLLSSIKDRTIVLIGGKAERARGEQLAQQYTHVHNFAGKLNIGGSTAVIELATWVITPDTGMMHIAAALGKNIISLWGNTIPAFGMTPYLPREHQGQSHIIERVAVSCRPCSKIGHAKCPKGHFNCMKGVGDGIIDLL